MRTLDRLLLLTPDEVAALPEPDRVAYEAALSREAVLQSPAHFAAACSGGYWLPYRHLVHTSERIVAMIEDDVCDCLLVEEPVRHGKTLLCSRWTPAWYVIRYRRPVLLASYEGDFAATHGGAARGIVEMHGPRFGVRVDPASSAKHRWEIEGSDAGMQCAGAGGAITGKGGGLLIVDDPIKNRDQAESAAERDHQWDWWESVWLTRREPNAKLLVIMSRWNTDDLIGRLVQHPGNLRIERIHLPAICEDDEPDPIGRSPGQALCPERYDEVALAGFRLDVGPQAWSSLYQQRPTPAGGGKFRRSSFRYWTAETVAGGQTWYRLGDHMVDSAECWRFATMDPAFTRTKASDFTVMAVWAVAPTDPPSLMLLDRARIRVEAAEHAKMVMSLWQTWHPAWVGIERSTATLSLLTDVQRDGVVIRELRPDRNKIARAETAVAVMEQSRVWFPRGVPWLWEWENELLEFPVGAHDDQVDVLAYACIELARSTVRPRRLHRQPATREERCWKAITDREKAHRYDPILGATPA
jgi:predicted phage terminase large subunit-like protein